MKKRTFTFYSGKVDYYFDGYLAQLGELTPKHRTILVTDIHVYAKHKGKFKGWKCIVIEPGEENKTQATADSIVLQLLEAGADRTTTLVGVGGGVVTDITGYVAGIYMRGVRFGFIPTTILGMVDASVGGKSGVNVGEYKNMVGLIRQPSFLLYDTSLLKTLPKEEWANGFAEIIKHACIKDSRMFNALEESSLSLFQKDTDALVKLIQRNVMLKSKVVANDEFESGERRILNFGHTAGHAIEKLYRIPHGYAVSIGIGIACRLSESLLGFKDTVRILALLKKYGLPPHLDFDKEEVLRLMMKDKKKESEMVNYILLDRVGKPVIHPLPVTKLKELLLSH